MIWLENPKNDSFIKSDKQEFIFLDMKNKEVCIFQYFHSILILLD
jgi:hypothetical protein